MFPPEISVKPYWCLYDTMSGQTILKYPWREGQEVPCPHCGNRLLFKNYVANCCGEAFRSGSGEIHQKRPVATHTKRIGRGWTSLRPYPPTHGDGSSDQERMD